MLILTLKVPYHVNWVFVVSKRNLCYVTFKLSEESTILSFDACIPNELLLQCQISQKALRMLKLAHCLHHNRGKRMKWKGESSMWPVWITLFYREVRLFEVLLYLLHATVYFALETLVKNMQVPLPFLKLPFDCNTSGSFADEAQTFMLVRSQNLDVWSELRVCDHWLIRLLWVLPCHMCFHKLLSLHLPWGIHLLLGVATAWSEEWGDL